MTKEQNWRAQWDAELEAAQNSLMASEDVLSYARTMQSARISIGSADWKERVRWYLRLGPAKWMIQSAETHFALMRAIDKIDAHTTGMFT